MKHSVYSMTLDVTQRHKQVFLPVMLGDTARSLMMTLVSGGAPFLLDVGTLAVFSGQKADGTTLYNHCIIEDGVRVRYDFTEHTASAEGVVECQLLIYGADGTLLASPRFCLVVDARVVYGDVTVSENEKNAIDAMMLSEASRVLAEEKRASAEVARSSAESVRETAEAERLAAESVRLATEQARLDAERIRDTSESARIEKEALRLRAEEDRAAAEAERLTAETARAGAETVRLASETERLDGEKSRVSSETARLLAEELRQESETARIQAENLRLSEERARESAEKTRASAEVGRGNAETARVRAESARTSAETERMTSETARKDAEALRAEAESVREQGYRSFDGRIAENAARVSANHKRITNLERRLSDEMFLSDSEITYQRSVPEDALPFAAVAEIGGMSYKSRNLFDENRFVELSNGVKNSDGSYTVSSAKMGRASLSLIGKANMQYTVSLTVTNQTTNKATYVIFKYSDGTEDAYGNRYFNAVGNYTFVSETNKTAVRVSFIHNDENTFTIKDFMLNEGETALPYEPYFEGLRDAKVTAVESEGRSLFPASAVYGSWATEVVKDGRNCYRFITNANRQFAPIAFKENTQYTVRFDVCAAKMQTDAEPTDRPLVIFYTDGTTKPLALAADGVWKTRTATSDVGKTVKSIGIISYEYRIYNYLDIDSFVFVEGTEIPDGTKPYFKNTFPIPEAVQALEGYGQGVSAQYHNKIVLDPENGVKKFMKMVKRIVLDGTEKWQTYINSGVNQLYFEINPVPVGSSEGKVFTVCSHYKSIPISDRINNFETCYSSSNSICFNTEKFATVEEWKTYLAEQYAAGTPVTVVYAIAEPTTEDISDSRLDDNFIGVEGGGTITAANEYGFDAPLTVEYMLKEATV